MGTEARSIDVKEPIYPPPSSRRQSLWSKVFQFAVGRDRSEPPVAEALLAPSGGVAVADPEVRDDGRRQSPESRLYLEARRQIKRRAWGHAQRALEEAVRREPDSPADLDLKSLRIIRRTLHRVARWPSDIDSHLDLGRAYFDLDLGDDALAEFVLVQHLAPRRYEGFALATLEYLYRGEYTHAASTWLRARDLNEELPIFDDLIGDLPLK